MESKQSFQINFGEVAVFPTDTQIALGCKFGDEAAAKKIFELKKRDPNKLLQILLPTNWEESSVIKFVESEYIEEVKKLAKKFWPGALTIVVPASFESQKTFGLRVPNSEISQKILKTNGPLWATSANISGDFPFKTVENAKDFWKNQINNYIDFEDKSADECLSQIASTVVKLSFENGMATHEILRQGSVNID